MFRYYVFGHCPSSCCYIDWAQLSRLFCHAVPEYIVPVISGKCSNGAHCTLSCLLCQVMESLYGNGESAAEFSQRGDATQPDFSPEELCILKTVFLEVEKAIDDIPVESGGSTFDGGFIVELLAKAQVCGEIKILNGWQSPPIHQLLCKAIFGNYFSL